MGASGTEEEKCVKSEVGGSLKKGGVELPKKLIGIRKHNRAVVGSSKKEIHKRSILGIPSRQMQVGLGLVMDTFYLKGLRPKSITTLSKKKKKEYWVTPTTHTQAYRKEHVENTCCSCNTFKNFNFQKKT